MWVRDNYGLSTGQLHNARPDIATPGAPKLLF
jgi:hypothetical protein